jgi:hypothetical protein
MTIEDTIEYEDVGEALREGRSLRRARGYRIRFAQDDLNFRPLDVPDPVPLGRQILSAAGLKPRQGYSLFAILPSGDFEDVRLDEPFDLRERGVECFVAFLTDRDFKLEIDESEVRWGKPGILGRHLYELGKVPDDRALYLRVPGGEDRLIEPDELIDLTAPGIERFVTATAAPKTYVIIVNSRERTVVGRRVTFEQIVEFAFPGPQPENTKLSMTYRHAASVPHAGELGAGGFVDVKQGTVFNVYRTIKS